MGKWKFPIFSSTVAWQEAKGNLEMCRLCHDLTEDRVWWPGAMQDTPALPPYLHPGACFTPQLVSNPQIGFSVKLTVLYLWPKWDSGPCELQCSSQLDPPWSFMGGTKKSHEVFFKAFSVIFSSHLFHVFLDMNHEEKSCHFCPWYYEEHPRLHTKTQTWTCTSVLAHSTRSHLSWCTHGPVQRRPFLCFAEVGVLGVATPQLLAGIKRTELKHKKNQSRWCFDRALTWNCNRSCSTVGFFLF